jgi:hypothetical protein
MYTDRQGVKWVDVTDYVSILLKRSCYFRMIGKRLFACRKY